MRLEGLGQSKNPVASLGLEPVIFRLVAYCLNQLRYRVPIRIKKFIGSNNILVEWLAMLAIHRKPFSVRAPAVFTFFVAFLSSSQLPG
jgi:hypothetical protein